MTATRTTRGAATNGASDQRNCDESRMVVTDWEAATVTHRGSWWTDYNAWLEVRGGRRVPAPKQLGSCAYTAIARAPGTYGLAS
jgi:polyhydroxyalkanoate synthase